MSLILSTLVSTAESVINLWGVLSWCFGHFLCGFGGKAFDDVHSCFITILHAVQNDLSSVTSANCLSWFLTVIFFFFFANMTFLLHMWLSDTFARWYRIHKETTKFALTVVHFAFLEGLWKHDGAPDLGLLPSLCLVKQSLRDKSVEQQWTTSAVLICMCHSFVPKRLLMFPVCPVVVMCSIMLSDCHTNEWRCANEDPCWGFISAHTQQYRF